MQALEINVSLEYGIRTHRITRKEDLRVPMRTPLLCRSVSHNHIRVKAVFKELRYNATILDYMPALF